MNLNTEFYSISIHTKKVYFLVMFVYGHNVKQYTDTVAVLFVYLLVLDMTYT